MDPTALPREPDASTRGWWWGIVSVGVVARVLAVASFEVWTDEIASLALSRFSGSEFVEYFATGQDLHPPFYYAVLWLLPSGNEQLLRTLSSLLWWLVLAGAVRWLMREHEEPRPALLVLLALGAAAPTMVYLGAELRMYAPLVSLSTLLVAAAAAARRSARPWLAGAAVGVLAAVAGLTHYSGFALAGGALAVLLALRWRAGVAAGVTLAAALAAYSPILLQHLAKQVPYGTPLPETAYFAGLLAVFAVPALFARRLRLEGTTLLAAGSGAALLALAVASLVLRGTNVLTLGVTTALVWITAVGFACSVRELSWPRLQVAVVVVAALAAPLVVTDPSVLEENRVSTVAAYEAVGRPQGTLVHVDWTRTNAYFESRVDQPVRSVYVGDPSELPEVVAEAEEPVLLVSRIAPKLVDRYGLDGEPLNEYVWRLASS